MAHWWGAMAEMQVAARPGDETTDNFASTGQPVGVPAPQPEPKEALAWATCPRAHCWGVGAPPGHMAHHPQLPAPSQWGQSLPPGHNLLPNPCGNHGFRKWTRLSRRGRAWAPFLTCFLPAYSGCHNKKVLNLEEEGFWPELLDGGKRFEIFSDCPPVLQKKKAPHYGRWSPGVKTTGETGKVTIWNSGLTKFTFNQDTTNFPPPKSHLIRRCIYSKLLFFT